MSSSSPERSSSFELREKLEKATAPPLSVAEEACKTGDIHTVRWYLEVNPIGKTKRENHHPLSPYSQSSPDEQDVKSTFGKLFTAAIANKQVRILRELLRQDAKLVESWNRFIFRTVLKHPDPDITRAVCERFSSDDRLVFWVLNCELEQHIASFLLRACELPPQHSYVASILLEYGADPNPSFYCFRWGALGIAIPCNQPLSLLKEIVTVGKAPIQSVHISLAVTHRRREFLKFVLCHGFEPWNDKRVGNRLLKNAKETNDEQILKLTEKILQRCKRQVWWQNSSFGRFWDSFHPFSRSQPSSGGGEFVCG
jgi:hypothetical protein